MTSKASVLHHMKQDAQNHGYSLCPDKSLLEDLLQGIVTNTKRYGYGSCPCRIGCGNKTYDVDIICPCEYRDADVNEFGMCYCGLFVNKDIADDPSKLGPIPERRPVEIQDAALQASEQQPTPKKQTPKTSTKLKKTIPVYRCTVCGYLCARDSPPPICPICKAKAERFEQFSIG